MAEIISELTWFLAVLLAEADRKLKIKTPDKAAIMAVTTRSSIRVNPPKFCFAKFGRVNPPPLFKSFVLYFIKVDFKFRGYLFPVLEKWWGAI